MKNLRGFATSEALIYGLSLPNLQSKPPLVCANNDYTTSTSKFATGNQKGSCDGEFQLEDCMSSLAEISCGIRINHLILSLGSWDCLRSCQGTMIGAEMSYRPPPWPDFLCTDRKIGAFWALAIGRSYCAEEDSGGGLCNRDGSLACKRVWKWKYDLPNPWKCECSHRSLSLFPQKSLYKFRPWGVLVLHTSLLFSSSSKYYKVSILIEISLVFLVMAPTTVDKGKTPMVAEDPAPNRCQTAMPKGKPKGSKLVEETPISNDGGDGLAVKARKKFRKATMNTEKLLALQGKVQENISVLHQSSIFATIIGDPMEAREVRKRMRYVWKSLSGGFQLIPIANNWFELRFDLSEDRAWVWDNRPFHVAGQLLLLRPWRLDFDPWSESVTLLDMWIRFPCLPAKYVNDELLRDIVKTNHLGEIIKVSAFNAKGARFRYPRVCVSVDITKIAGREVFVVNEHGEVESFPMWFEDFPVGCGGCGDSNHQFDECPRRNACNVANGVGMQTPVMHIATAEEQAQVPGDGEWVRVAARRPIVRPPPMFGHSKDDLLKCFGKNVTISSDSSSSKSPGESAGNASSATHAPVADMVLAPEPISMVVPIFPAVTVPTMLSPSKAPPNDEKLNYELELQPGLHPHADDDDDYLEFDEDDFMEECLVEEGLADPGLTQADYEVIFRDVPPSIEFNLPNLDDPERLEQSLLDATVTPFDPTATTNRHSPAESGTESGKRKMKTEEGDSACSTMTLMGGSTKKGKHV